MSHSLQKSVHCAHVNIAALSLIIVSLVPCREKKLLSLFMTVCALVSVSLLTSKYLLYRSTSTMLSELFQWNKFVATTCQGLSGILCEPRASFWLAFLCSRHTAQFNTIVLMSAAMCGQNKTSRARCVHFFDSQMRLMYF